MKAKNEYCCNVTNSSMYSSNAILQLEGKQNCEVNVDLQTINNRPLSFTFKVIVENCPPGITNNGSSLLVTLPSTPNKTELDMFICKSQNRTGRLCGECVEGYCISPDFLTFHCINSSSQQVNGVLILILSKYLPLFFCVS